MLKKLILFSCLSLLLCSLVFAAVPSSVSAESDVQGSAVPFPRFKAVGLAVFRTERSTETDARHMVNIPVDGNLNAYIDLKPTASPDEPKRTSGPALRTVFGFHIPIN